MIESIMLIGVLLLIVASIILKLVPDAKETLLDTTKEFVNDLKVHRLSEVESFQREATEETTAYRLTDLQMHGIVCGKTNSGKSVFLSRLVILLLRAGHQVYVLDHKGGLDYALFVGLRNFFLYYERDNDPQVDLGLDIIAKEAERRTDLFFKLKVRNIKEYRELGTEPELQTITVIGDELASFTDKQKMRLATMIQRYRAIGIHFYLATQRPTKDGIPHNIQAQTSWRIVLRTNATDARYACRVDSKAELRLDPSKLRPGQGIFIDHENDVWLQIEYPDLPLAQVRADVKELEEAEAIPSLSSNSQPTASPDECSQQETATM